MSSTQGRPDDDGNERYTVVSFLYSILFQVLAATSAVTLPLYAILVANILELVISVPVLSFQAASGELVGVSITAVIRSTATAVLLERVVRFLWYGPSAVHSDNDGSYSDEVRWLRHYLVKLGLVGDEDDEEHEENNGSGEDTTANPQKPEGLNTENTDE